MARGEEMKYLILALLLTSCANHQLPERDEVMDDTLPETIEKCRSKCFPKKMKINVFNQCECGGL